MEDVDFIALNYIPEIGPVTIKRLIAAFGSPEAVFGAGTGELISVEGMSRKKAEAIRGFADRKRVANDMERLKAEGFDILIHGKAGYPEALMNFPDAPPVLYSKGKLTADDRFSIAIVGSRRPTHYGLNTAQSIASELASMGFTVVSGLARGIDTAAHKGALQCGGRGIAVLGSGIDVPYPPENKGLMEKISSSGAVLSEFPPGTPPYSLNFPRRNRIISGLSMGVLVAEASGKSGALITVKYALEQGREVFAVPGNISSAVSQGTNELIKQGAKIVLKAGDIVEELAPMLRGFIKSKEKVKISVTEEEKRLCDILSPEPVHIDNLSRESGMAAHKALSVLLSLELKGVVRQMEGKRFHLI